MKAFLTDSILSQFTQSAVLVSAKKAMDTMVKATQNHGPMLAI